MKRSISDNQKKTGRGRPATGVTPMWGVRFPEDLAAAIQAWAVEQPDSPSRAEAVRRLVELGLKAKPKR